MTCSSKQTWVVKFGPVALRILRTSQRDPRLEHTYTAPWEKDVGIVEQPLRICLTKLCYRMMSRNKLEHWQRRNLRRYIQLKGKVKTLGTAHMLVSICCLCCCSYSYGYIGSSCYNNTHYYHYGYGCCCQYQGSVHQCPSREPDSAAAVQSAGLHNHHVYLCLLPLQFLKSIFCSSTDNSKTSRGTAVATSIHQSDGRNSSRALGGGLRDLYF